MKKFLFFSLFLICSFFSINFAKAETTEIYNLEISYTNNYLNYWDLALLTTATSSSIQEFETNEDQTNIGKLWVALSVQGSNCLANHRILIKKASTTQFTDYDNILYDSGTRLTDCNFTGETIIFNPPLDVSTSTKYYLQIGRPPSGSVGMTHWGFDTTGTYTNGQCWQQNVLKNYDHLFQIYSVSTEIMPIYNINFGSTGSATTSTSTIINAEFLDNQDIGKISSVSGIDDNGITYTIYNLPYFLFKFIFIILIFTFITSITLIILKIKK